MKKIFPVFILSLCCHLLMAQERAVFIGDFDKGLPPLESAAPCRAYQVGAELVDTPAGKVVRFGKKADGSLGRIVYCLQNPADVAKLTGVQTPFPLRQGRLCFKFRPVDWELGVPGFNMLLIMHGPRGARLHVTYLRPTGTGLPSVQVGYGVPGGETRTPKKQPALFPYVKLNTGREWHEVEFSWSPSQVKLTVDGESVTLTTLYLELPDDGFYGESLEIGTDVAVNLNGLSDMMDLRIYADEIAQLDKQLRLPFLLAPKMQASNVDGKIEAAEYAGALKTSGFLSLPGGKFAPRQSSVYFGHDDENLYFALSSSGHSRKPLAAKFGRDSSVWEDDSIDLMLDPTPETPDFYQFIFNWNGALYDSHVVPGRNDAVNRAWNSEGVRYATMADEQVWQLEAAIPLKNFGKLPAASEEWSFSVCETNIGDGIAILVNAIHGALEYDKYGTLKFGEAGDPVFRLEQIGDLHRGEIDLVCQAERLELNCRRYDETAMTEFPLFGDVVTAEDGVCRFLAGQDRFGKNGTLYLNCYSGTQLVYAAKWPYEAFDAASIENMRRIPATDGNEELLRVTSSQSGGEKLSLRFALTDSAGKQVKEFPLVPVTALRQESLRPLAGIAPGEYLMQMSLVNADGAIVKQSEPCELVVYAPGKLPWQGNTLGISEEVPPPWTALRLQKNEKGLEIFCWNRCYAFQHGELFPGSILSGEKEYLASPPMLSADTDGKKLIAAGGTWQILTESQRRIVLENRGSIPGLGSLTVCATIDYDGFIWFDVKMGDMAGANLSVLRLSFLIPKSQARLLNSGYRDLTDTGELPAQWSKMLVGQFGAFWVGNEEGGLSFGIESDQYWRNSDSGKQVTLQQIEAGCEISLNFLDYPAAITLETQYGFYVMPTPVRPCPKVMRTLRTMMFFAHNREEASGNHYPHNLSWWTASYQYQGSPAWFTDAKGIQEWGRNSAYDINIRPYYHYDSLPDSNYQTAWYATYSSVARNAPETIWQGEFWRAGEKDKLYGNAVYSYHDDMIEVCKTDDYCDYYLWCYDQSRRNDPKIGGLYFDLMQYPPCARADHGHGYPSEKGRKVTFAIREHRKFLERVYQYSRQGGTAAPIVMHMSGATARVAGFSFADYYVDGELWSEILVRDRSYYRLKLAQMRAELLPHIYGYGMIYISQLYRIMPFVPAEQRRTWKMSPWAERHIAAMLLIHDVVPDRTSMNEVAFHVWKALDKFGLDEDASLCPYWKPESLGHPTNADGENTVANIWRSADGRELLMCFNNQDEPFCFKIGHCRGFSAEDLESGEKLPIFDDELQIVVSERNFRLIELKSEVMK